MLAILFFSFRFFIRLCSVYCLPLWIMCIIWMLQYECVDLTRLVILESRSLFFFLLLLMFRAFLFNFDHFMLGIAVYVLQRYLQWMSIIVKTQKRCIAHYFNWWVLDEPYIPKHVQHNGFGSRYFLFLQFFTIFFYYFVWSNGRFVGFFFCSFSLLISTSCHFV